MESKACKFRLAMRYSIQLSTNKLPKLLPRYKRLALPVCICLLLISASTRELTVSVLADAFWQVAVFVAFTLAVYHLFADKLHRLYQGAQGHRSPNREVVVASLMGMLPGCGGAIVVITQFVQGKLSFGAVVAVLTATMGDAAFLLIAAEPMTGVGVITLSFLVGILSGLIVNSMHGADFLASNKSELNTSISRSHTSHIRSLEEQPVALKVQGVLWKWLIVPGAIMGFLVASQVDVASLMLFSDSAFQLLGAMCSLGFIFLWAITREITNFESIVAEDKKSKKSKAFQKVALDTNFVTSWVVLALLVFELTISFGNIRLEGLFNQVAILAPLAGVVVGMIPGCGPQIITTSLYLSGAIPLSAQIGNAISNDGDALFPAIALSPKVALVATIYSSIPALIAAYGYFFIFE